MEKMQQSFHAFANDVFGLRKTLKRKNSSFLVGGELLWPHMWLDVTKKQTTKQSLAQTSLEELSPSMPVAACGQASEKYKRKYYCTLRIQLSEINLLIHNSEFVFISFKRFFKQDVLALWIVILNAWLVNLPGSKNLKSIELVTSVISLLLE